MKTNKTNDGDGRKTRPKPAEIFQTIKESQIISRELPTHPEAHFLRKFPWEGMLTIRFASADYSVDNHGANSRRDAFVKEFMGHLIHYKFLQEKWHVYWVAVTEYGISGVAHVHIIFNFIPLESKGNEPIPFDSIEEDAMDSLNVTCDILGVSKKSVDLNWQLSFDDLGLVNYVTKIEPGKPDKHFLWSPDLKKWRIPEFIAEVTATKEGNQ